MDEREQSHSCALTAGRVVDEAAVVEGYAVGVLGAVEVTVIKGHTECTSCEGEERGSGGRRGGEGEEEGRG